MKNMFEILLGKIGLYILYDHLSKKDSLNGSSGFLTVFVQNKQHCIMYANDKKNCVNLN